MTSHRPHTLPREINASTMVLRSERSAGLLLLDFVLTIAAWLSFAYLLARGIQANAPLQQDSGMPWLSQLMPTLSDLSVYALAMLLQGLLLILWARYNVVRFRGKQRRAAVQPVPELNLTDFYGIEAESLQRLRDMPISVIHHAEDGSILSVEGNLLAGQAQPVPEAVVEPPAGR